MRRGVLVDRSMTQQADRARSLFHFPQPQARGRVATAPSNLNRKASSTKYINPDEERHREILIKQSCVVKIVIASAGLFPTSLSV